MVRFARAKGSKYSNEKLPEEATPWQEIKQQMIDAQQEKVKDAVFDVRRNFEPKSSVETTWATFENSEPKTQKKTMRLSSPGKDDQSVQNMQAKKKQKTELKDGILHSEAQQESKCFEDVLTNIDDVTPIEVKKEDKKADSPSLKHRKGELEPQEDNVLEHENNDILFCQTKEKTMLGKMVSEDLQEENLLGNKDCSIVTCHTEEGKKNQGEGTQFLKLKETGLQKSQEDHITENEDEIYFSQSESCKNIQIQPTQLTFIPKRTSKKQKNLNKFKTFPNSGRRPKDRMVSSTIYVEGRKVEICVFDGFPVKKDDWIRLTDLQKKMRAEKIPNDQIKAAMQLERRRAEKALARERKKVCFHCRRPGHMLSDCPSLQEAPMRRGKDIIPDTANTGICFKCGSTEHSYLQCRVVKQNEFRFAKCFVCEEQGHISRQCPDNPRGMYPKGGACRICGDVTHLRKDCPKSQEKQESTAPTLQTLKDGGALEALDTDSYKSVDRTPKISPKKVIKF